MPVRKALRRNHLLSLSALWIGLLIGMILIQGRKGGPDPRSSLQGQWGWSDSSIFEFQKITFRFSPDSFYMVHRFMDPGNPRTRLPCAQPDYHMYVAGNFRLEEDSLIRFDGNYTDAVFSRDTLRLCRDTGFRARTFLDWREERLCLKGEVFAKWVCFEREPARK